MDRCGRVAVITARGGSRRIPMKNIKEFCGRPIISYSIHAALESGLFEEVMVSTDSREIAQAAVQYGACVPFLRSPETADDYATTSDVLLEVLGEYEKRGKFFENICCIYPAAPFVTADRLRQAAGYLQENDVDAVVPVAEFSYPPQRGLILENNLLKMKYPEHMDARSQDLERVYHDCGQFYFMKTESFKKYKKILAGRILPVILPEMEVQDIDTIEDWRTAELKYQIANGIIKME